MKNPAMEMANKLCSAQAPLRLLLYFTVLRAERVREYSERRERIHFWQYD